VVDKASILKSFILETERLILRPPCSDDIPRIVEYAGSEEVARMTLTIPHPYKPKHAEEFIAFCEEETEARRIFTFAITYKPEDTLVGCMGIGNDTKHRSGELGYWMGKPHWGKGYTTEAARRMLKFGFEVLHLNRIYATHFADNPASGRVMQKIGMAQEGVLRQCYHRWGQFRDAVCYSILKAEYLQNQ